MNCQAALTHWTKCKKCRQKITAEVLIASATYAGSHTSKRKARASRLNGKLGGRPKKS